MERPTIDATSAVLQAGTTVSCYLQSAVEMLDRQFGECYAEANPALVAALVQAQTADFNACVMACALWRN